MLSCLEFKKNCENSKNKVLDSLKKMKKDGKKICGYAATAKSTTVLNYCNLNTDTIDFICDTTKEKIGKFSPGMHIPIVPVSHFHKNLPDVAYLFAWNHKDEIFSKEKEFLKKGGSWFSHVPYRKILQITIFFIHLRKFGQIFLIAKKYPKFFLK